MSAHLCNVVDQRHPGLVGPCITEPVERANCEAIGISFPATLTGRGEEEGGREGERRMVGGWEGEWCIGDGSRASGVLNMWRMAMSLTPLIMFPVMSAM